MDFFPPYIPTVLVLLLGLAVGSFTNVLIYRLPRGMSLITPRSSCPSCQSPIRWYQNVPVVSYLFLRGRCSSCRRPISIRYPLVEIASGLLFVAFFWRYGYSLTTVGFGLFSLGMLAVFFIDLDCRIIPDVITLPGIGVGVVLSLASSHLSIGTSLLGVLAGGGSFLAVALLGQWLFKRESMGGGDIKLAAMLGAFLGPSRIFLILILSAIIGLAVSVIVMAISARFRKDRTIPYGPFLVMAAYIAVFYGGELIDWYTRTVIGP